MIKKFSQKKNKTPIIVSIIGVFLFLQSASAQGIRQITSEKNAKKVETALDTPKTTSQQSSPSSDNELKVHSLGIGLGQAFLKGDFEKNGEDKITWDILYNYSASHSFDFMANFHTHQHKFRGKEVSLTGLAFSIKAKLVQFDNFAPFGLGGLGFYWPKLKREINGEILESETKTTFGLNLGGGGDLKLNRNVTVGMLAQYHNPFDVKQELGEDVEGSYFKLLVTALYSF